MMKNWVKVTTIATVLVLIISVFFFMQPAKVDAGLAKTKFLGNIIAGSVPSNFATYWNQVTPENSTKWGSVEGSRDSMNWSQADMAYNYARSNGMPFKFHTLVWGSQEPSWIKSLSATDQKAEVQEWIQAAGARYGGSQYVDVVNEPLHAVPSYSNAIGGGGSTGWDWVVWSFEQARAAFPNSKLLINEYGIISDPNATSRYLSIINILKSRGLVDGIGIQCHYFNMDTVSTSTMRSVLSSLAATGLPIYVSELDMTGDDATQKARYQEKFPVLWENSAVQGITLWGYIEGQTWASGTHLITSSGAERPALQWLRTYLASYTATPTPVKTATPAPTPTPGLRSAFSQIEAESFNTQSGIQTESCGEGGQNIGYIENGDYAVYNNIDFGGGATSFQARVASATSGGNIEIRIDSITGTLVGTCSVAGTGDWQTWTTSTCSVNGVTGTHDLYLKFTGGSGYLFNINWFQFFSVSVNTPTPVRTPSPVVTPTPTTVVTPTPTPDTGNYVVVYTIQNDWGSGATVDVKIINNTGAAVNGWTLAFTFPGNQTITNAWSGAYTQNGASVTVKDAGYNAGIPANGGSVNFGFNLNYSGTNAKPAGFTLNGTACQVQ
jgi:endo-1,4-beta-xylanase